MVMVHLPYTRIYDLIINVCVFMYTIWRRDNFAELIALVYKQKQQQQQFNVHKKRDHKVIKNEHETKNIISKFSTCMWLEVCVISMQTMRHNEYENWAKRDSA